VFHTAISVVDGISEGYRDFWSPRAGALQDRAGISTSGKCRPANSGAAVRRLMPLRRWNDHWRRSVLNKTLLARNQVGPDDPLRLNVAASLAYPDGSMTASGLRREASKGRLVIERSAGKDYTTLANIQHMREKCRVEAMVHDSGYNLPEKTGRGTSSNRPSGSSEKAQQSAALDAARAKLSKLQQHSATTSTPSPQSDLATVTHPPLPLRT
jgi:hypothetical protein